MDRPLRIGTRASALARWQANWVADRVAEQTGVPPELVLIATSGDQRAAAGPVGMAEQGIFTKEIQRALLADEIDIAVHSLKDLPTEVVPGLMLGAAPARESPFDVLVSRSGQTWSELPAGAVIGTSSLRRRAHLLHARPDLVMADIRGNVDTRLGKLDAGNFDAIVLAHAGLRRLGLAARVTDVLHENVILPAVGQGALGIEARQDDLATLGVLSKLDDVPTHAAVIAERTLLAKVGGGCLAPVGALASDDGAGGLRLRAAVCNADGSRRIEAAGTGAIAEAVALGNRVAAELLAQGAAALIESCRQP